MRWVPHLIWTRHHLGDLDQEELLCILMRIVYHNIITSSNIRTNIYNIMNALCTMHYACD